jgi:hypothetical protein
MVSYSELEYGGIVKILDKLEDRFTVRAAEPSLREHEETKASEAVEIC